MSTKINVHNVPTGYQSFISNGRHAIVGDEPIASKGTDLGFSPPEFLLAGISMCKAATVRNVARRNGWEIRDVHADVKMSPRRDKEGNFTTTVKSSIRIEGDITEEQRATLIHEADNCYVTRLVRGEWNFEDSEILEETREL